MLSHDFILDAKSIHKLSTTGLSAKTLKEQINDNLDFLLELWYAQGLKIVKHQSNYFFATSFIPIKDMEFCIVDIETNGSKIEKHQIIEIGAIKVKNGEIVGRYESFVNCHEINPNITEITGISVEDTKDAPSLKNVMHEFKAFLQDSVFVAHDIKFDYRFISLSMQNVGLAPLLNRSLCSLALAERTIESYRYALSYLNESLNLYPSATHHRAMSDALTTNELLKLSLKNIGDDIKSVEDLIRFSKEAKRLKRPKFNPTRENINGRTSEDE
ncbi:3'-5' exonuclease [Sulfurimonas sp.]|uniref:3'-5' exonuclease n=1 Tax=Sulfurimonas sp. TaxID=2022749 RepID=UPI0025CF50E8|nr:3'-5' exonuclease [Sulfurimonas sp.]MDD5158119.1 3'-5' exonuclease [Sulfurimonas sp.]